MTGFTSHADLDAAPAGAGAVAPLRVHRDDGVVYITLDRPRALNALNLEMLEELSGLLHSLADAMPRPLGLLLTGAGERAFCAGADVKELATLPVQERDRLAELGQSVPRQLSELPFLVIACINGLALGGGCELALGADIIYSVEAARFGQPEVALGLIPGFGGTVRLPRRVGPGLAAQMILGLVELSGAQARDAGLVDEVFADSDQMVAQAHGLLAGLAGASKTAIALAKQSLVRTAGMELGPALAAEAALYRTSLGSPDGREGAAAFAAKRPAQFTG